MTSEGARKAWETRKRNAKNAPGKKKPVSKTFEQIMAELEAMLEKFNKLHDRITKLFG
jgi:hypothetical protein